MQNLRRPNADTFESKAGVGRGDTASALPTFPYRSPRGPSWPIFRVHQLAAEPSLENFRVFAFRKTENAEVLVLSVETVATGAESEVAAKKAMR